MITKRIIPCLDVRNGRVVKGVNFEGLSDVSSPVELAQFYSDCGADELVFLDITASSDDMSQLLDMVFSPDDNILIGGDEPPTFNTEGEDMLGEALPPRSYQRNIEELDALLGSMDSFGFGLTSREEEEAANAAQSSDEGAE